MKISLLSISAIASLVKGDIAGIRSAKGTDPSEIQDSDGSTGLTTATNTPLVDYLYTYGAPATVKNSHHANPGNKCIPGIRVYDENASWGRVHSTDAGSQINAAWGYGHPKISTLVLRWDGDWQYYWFECKDSDNKDYYEWEWYPKWSGVWSLHSLDKEYEPRLKAFYKGDSERLGKDASAFALASPLLDYTSVTWCNGLPTKEETTTCLETYNSAHPGVAGVAPLGYEVDGFMIHTDPNGDNDGVYTLNNNGKCIITFQQSREIADFGSFFLGGTTGYCGRQGVHIGVRNELWQITHDPQWASNIKPALEKCDEVTCVGFSLGGSLCSVFTMCANTGPEYLVGNTSWGMQDDYDSLAWNKKGSSVQQDAKVTMANE